MLSKTSIILIAFCTVLFIIDTGFFNNFWLDIFVFATMLGALIFSKEKIIGIHEYFGKIIYYGFLGALLFFIYVKWF
jgi:hypothetical protein